MATFSAAPGVLNLSFVRGDDFAAIVDVSLDLTGYTTTASITSSVTGAAVIPFTVSAVSPSEGKISLSLTDSQTSSLARGTYSWRMVWVEGTATKTALAGAVEVL